MFYYTHNGSDHCHEVRIVTDNLGKFMDLLEICKNMGEDDDEHDKSDEEYKAPWEEDEEEKKSKFRFEDYENENSVCMCCHNQTDYEKFNQLVIDSGRECCIGHYDEGCNKDVPRCIYFLEGCTGSLDFAENEDEDDPLILYYEDFDWDSKPKFSFDDYPNNYFMRCASPEESEIFYKVMCERFANKCITFNKDCTMFRWGKGDGFFLGEYGGSENGAYENHGFKELIFSDFNWSDYEN